MNTRTLIPALLLAAALPAAADTLHYNIIEFSESASMEVPRDTAAARLRIRAEGRDRSAVAASFVQKYNTVSRKARDEGFKTELLYRNVSPRYQYKDGKSIQTGWTEEAVLKTETTRTDALNKFIAAVQDQATLDGITFSVSAKKREEVIDEVSKTALQRFRKRADTISRSLGHSGYKIVKLDLGHIGSHSESESHTAYSRAALKAVAAAESAPAPEFTQPGTEEIGITVRGSVQM